MIRKIALLTALLLITYFAWAGQPSATLTQDEQALKQVGIERDGQSLLTYFQRRTPTPEEQTSLRARLKHLGSGQYVERARATDALIRAGRPALAMLREFARNSDVETARRAQYCIRVIEQNTKLGLAAPASRVLAERNPPGALATLLAYLPFADEEWVQEEVRQSVKKLAQADNQANGIFEKALTDPAPARRAAAAWILGASPDARQRDKAVALLNDPSADVRFLTASSLLAFKETKAVPVLIDLLTPDHPDLAWRAEDLLFRLAGDHGPNVWLDTASDNQGQKVRAAWEVWWKSHASKIDWASLDLGQQPRGLTLVAENQRPDGTGRLYECAKNGDIRWQVPIRNPIDAQWLPGGRLLVADSRANQVYEMDTRGNIGWKHIGIAPTSIQRLPNGNTVISTYQSIVEVTRQNKVVFTHKTQGHTYHARKIPNGHYVWIDASGDVGEVDGKGKLIAKIRVGSGLAWGSIERLRNGRYLIALGGVGKVQEIDMSGKVYWERAVNNPNRAIRLANGHTLVASHGDGCVYEFDAAGQERWKHPCVGRPFAALRR